MDNNIVEKIDALPPLDDSIMQIQRICGSKFSSLNDLIKVVEKDPMLTANILKAANLSLYGFSGEIKNISHAVSMFGMATVRGFALSSSIKQDMEVDLSPYNITENEYLDISLTQSAFAFNWFSKVDREVLDLLVPAAFMINIGKIIIANDLIEKGLVKEFQEGLKEIKTLQDVSDLEIKLVGFDNINITAKIFEHWNLEPELAEIIKKSNNPLEVDEKLRVHTTALNIIKKIVNIFGKFSDISIEKALIVVEENGLDKEVFLNTVEQVKE